MYDIFCNMNITSKNKENDFIRLAEARTNKAIKSIELVGNLSNRACYEYSQAQVDAIFSAIQSTVSAQKSKFKNSPKKKFRL